MSEFYLTISAFAGLLLTSAPSFFRLGLIVFALHFCLPQSRKGFFRRCQQALYPAVVCNLILYFPVFVSVLISVIPHEVTPDKQSFECSLTPMFFWLIFTLFTSFIWGELSLLKRFSLSPFISTWLASLIAIILWPLMHFVAFLAVLYWPLD